MIDKKYESILKVMANHIFGTSFEKADESLIPEFISQAVFPLALINEKLSIAIIAANMQISYEHTELHNILTENNIHYVILKGVASASYYPNPIFRMMGDVDFLIDESDIPITTSLLERIGFEKAVEDDGEGIHITFYRDDSTWEMHRSINGIPEGKAGERVRLYLSDTIETAVDYDEGNGVIKIPDDFHHGLILLLHTASHLTSEGVGLRHLCDWAVFVNHFSNEQFTALFEEKLKACGLWRFAQLLSLTSVKYLHLLYQSWMGDADEGILEQLITDIMDSGNFGKKDEDRNRQIKYISNRGEHTVDQKSTVVQLWDTIARKAEAEGKSRLSVVGDYASMVISGKRKLDSQKTIKQAAERKKLYAEFHLFEP